MQTLLKTKIKSMQGLICITAEKDIPDWLADWNPDVPYLYLPENGKSIHKQASFVKDIAISNGIIVTYSSFIISEFKRKQVLVFKEDNTLGFPEFETFGASNNKINMCLFGRSSTIGELGNNLINDLSKRLTAGENPEDLMDEANKLGDSVEKILFMKTAIDSKTIRKS